ncbi:MAG TPA: HD domain-containing phosphohydrolase, partial [Candidatus Xenobia bacterium]
MTATLNERYRQLVLTVLVQLEQRNPYNVDHCRLVASYSDQLARHLKLTEEQRKRVVAAAEVHTLGVHLQMEEKRNPQGVPITALGLRSGRENSVEAREAEILEQILAPLEEYRDAIPVILARHEWFRGQADKLTPEARIMAVVDAFVDLATPKSHRDPLTLPEVMSRLKEQAGIQFDPRYVEGLDQVITSEQEQWGAGARARQFETARYRHWLSLGNFHRQAGETDWALRSYRKALDLADLLGDPWLRIQAVFGIFMVHHRAGDYERALDLLQHARPQVPEGRGKVRHWFMLMWGMLIWSSDKDANGEAILEEVVNGFEESGDLPGIAAARILLARMSLTKGRDDAGHLKRLQAIADLLAAH